MLGEVSRRFPFLRWCPIQIRALVSLLANIIDELQVIRHLTLGKGWCFIDVGAHVGAFSVLASRLVGHEGIVVSVEPDPDNFRALLFNIRLTGKNILPFKVAV